MPKGREPFLLQRYPQQIGEGRQNIQLPPGLLDNPALGHARHVHNQRYIEAADPRIVRDAERFFHLFRGNILGLQPEMIAVQHQDRMVPEAILLQPVNQGADGVVRIVDSSQIVTKHRILQRVRQGDSFEGIRDFEGMMAGSRHQLGIKWRPLGLQRCQLLHSRLIQLLIRSAEGVEMVIFEITLFIVAIKTQRRIQLIAVPEAHLVHMKSVRLIAFIPQKARQTWQHPVTEACGHRERCNRINGGIAHKLRIRGIARSDLLIDMREIKTFAGQAVQHRGQLLSIQRLMQRKVLKGLHLNHDYILPLL
ncbi:hypothetical protein D3C75_820030 [compost metagenome]